MALTLDSDPAGLRLTLGSETLAGPFTRDVVVGSSNPVTAVSPQSQGLSNYVFDSWSDGGAQTHTITAPATATTYKATYSAATVGATLVGTETVGPDVDNAPAGMAEAFRTTASTTGPVSWLTVYLDSSATATELVAGLYADAAGKPGALLTTGRLTSPAAGAWNRILVPSANVTAGGTYWIAVLGPAGKAGTMRFRDTLNGTGRAESSSSSTLTDLPTTWSTGTAYNDGPLSAYGAAAGGAAQPAVLAVAPSSLAFSGTAGAANPAAKTLSVTNTGGGSLVFTASDDAPWLSVTPASGSAPRDLSVSVDTTGLAAGSYSATVTVTSSGTSGSPKQIPVTLTVAAAPALSVTPASLSFSATAGGREPGLQDAQRREQRRRHALVHGRRRRAVAVGHARVRHRAARPHRFGGRQRPRGRHVHGQGDRHLDRVQRLAHGRAGDLHGRSAGGHARARRLAGDPVVQLGGRRSRPRLQDVQRHQHRHGLAVLHHLRRCAVALGDPRFRHRAAGRDRQRRHRGPGRGHLHRQRDRDRRGRRRLAEGRRGDAGGQPAAGARRHARVAGLQRDRGRREPGRQDAQRDEHGRRQPELHGSR